MKYKSHTVKPTSYIAGIFAIVSAMLVAIMLILCAIGFLFPRTQKLVLFTETVSKKFDGEPLSGGELSISYGELHPGHELVVLSECKYTNVGEYDNNPAYKIVDPSGSDVTDRYSIVEKFGSIIIEGRSITVFSPSKVKQYDGTALSSDEIAMTGGSLAAGHTFYGNHKTSITYPGEQEIFPSYYILDSNGTDVTEQYNIVSNIGTLTILPRLIKISTSSANKQYDGTPLSSSEWKHESGELLQGHELSVNCISEEIDVGSFDNKADVWIHDDKGNDVSELYSVEFHYGKLNITPMPLYIVSASASKEYDGTPLKCSDWRISSGKIGANETLTLLGSTEITNVGSVSNDMFFSVTDKNGIDVTHRYKITVLAGSLDLTPRSITIRTGSAQKIYDGTPLTCSEYEIIKGSLSKGEQLELALTSIVNIGYTQNYIVDYSILRTTEGGVQKDVSDNYRISYDYGTLTVTLK